MNKLVKISGLLFSSIGILFIILVFSRIYQKTNHKSTITDTPSSEKEFTVAKGASAEKRNTIIYQIWLNNYGKNALVNAEKKLDYIASLGVTTIQLSPVHPYHHTTSNPVSGSPYSIDNDQEIEPAYGTKNDFKKFVDHAHKNNLQVIMDVVMHSKPKTNITFQEHPEYFKKDATGQFVLNDYKMYVINYADKNTQTYFANVLTYWLKNFKVDGFRADVADSVPIEFWDTARSAINKINPNAVMIAEGSRTDNTKQNFDITYDIPHMVFMQSMYRDGLSAQLLSSIWNSNHSSFPARTLFIRTIDNHDQRRAITDLGVNGSFAANVINFTLDGVPFLFNGEEIGDSVATGVNYPMSIGWDQERSKPVTYDKGNIHLKIYRGGYKDELLPMYKELIALRKNNSVFTEGSVIWLKNSSPENIVSFERKDQKTNVYVLVNSSNKPFEGTVQIDSSAKITPMLQGYTDTYSQSGNSLQFTLHGFGYLVLKS